MAQENINKADLVDHFAVFFRKEKGVYQCLDYLSPDHQARLEQKAYIQSQIHTSSSAFRFFSSATSSTSVSTIEVWRDMFCEWTFKVIDYFELEREVVSISLNYLDRYLSIHAVDIKKFQLAAMTSLLLAIKLYGPKNLSISSFIEINCGNFETRFIAPMENSILWTLSWFVHPPTPLSFVRNCITLLEGNGRLSTIALEIEEEAQFLTELSVCDYYFATRKPSSTALGAIRVAFGNIDETTLPLHVRHVFFKRVRIMADIDPFSSEVEECKDRFFTTCLPDAGYLQEQRTLINERNLSPNNVVDVETYNSSKRK